MGLPTMEAENSWQSSGGNDFLQLKGAGGKVFSFIDAFGFPGGNLSGGGGSGAVLQVSVSLTSTQIKSLGSSPVQLVAAPGAGKTVLPIAGAWTYTSGGVAYDLSGASSPMLAVTPDTTVGSFFSLMGQLNISSGPSGGSGGLDTTVDSIGLLMAFNNGGFQGGPNALSNIQNKPLKVLTIDTGSGSPFVTFNPATGNGSLVVTVQYAII